ncbi:MAG: Rieske 2Fe-2S domain-containing protein [Actinomycetes bacterium]
MSTPPSSDHDNNPALADATPMPEHRERRSDVDAHAAKRAERQVGLLFLLSAVCSLFFCVAYFVVGTDKLVWVPGLGETSAANLALGLSMGIALFALGAAAIHWAKKLMPDVEVVALRHDEGSSDEAREAALVEYQRGVEESGIKRRPFIGGSLVAALAMVGLPAIVLLRDLGPAPDHKLDVTMWTKGTRILIAETKQPVRPADMTIGTLISAVPEGIDLVMEEEKSLDELAKAPVILVRMDPADIKSQQGTGWDVEGILCFSKICTHVGCPINLYEQQTHHLLCPCHQSTFDLADSANVVFGPAARALPQLAITVDTDGYLVAQNGFTQPVGPSFWERG